MKKPNKLVNEKSPYLLQHAYNPVDWYPWGEEAFEKAKAEDKPVFLSIGYSTCHWCHVMAHESFEDDEIANLLNENFISIKVDREERPDIDGVYMLTCQLLNGNGGWPLTAMLNYDKKPFFVGTYFPKNSSYGRPGLYSILENIINYWAYKREELLHNTKSIHQALQKANLSREGSIENEIFDKAFQILLKGYDEQNGGFTNPPKFPAPHNIVFLLRYSEIFKNKLASSIALNTLIKMKNGGIYDHLGHGFHRYSTDREWLVPHFEKMLYDQALIASAFIEAYNFTGNPFFKTTVQEIVNYLITKMISPEGLFYSAEDADTEDGEGKYYLWIKQDILNILSPQEAEVFCFMYNISDNGNFEENNIDNIVALKKDAELTSKVFNISKEEISTLIETARIKLLKHRDEKTKPLRDEKILLDWNSIVLSILIRCSYYFEGTKCRQVFDDGLSFIMNNFVKGNRLFHAYKDGAAYIDGFVDDYAFFTKTLLDAFEFTFNPEYLLKAIDLTEYFIQHFWDDNQGGFFTSPDTREELDFRQKEIYDGATPSGNSIAYVNLVRLYHITADSKYLHLADSIERTFSSYINSYPAGYTYFLLGLLLKRSDSEDFVVACNYIDKDTKEIIDFLIKRTSHFKTIMVITNQNKDLIAERIPYLKDFKPNGEKPFIYVCKDFRCSFPVSSLSELKQLLNSI